MFGCRAMDVELLRLGPSYVVLFARPMHRLIVSSGNCLAAQQPTPAPSLVESFVAMHGEDRSTQQEPVHLVAAARIKHRFSAECVSAARLKNGKELASPDISRKTEPPLIVTSSSLEARVTDKRMRT